MSGNGSTSTAKMNSAGYSIIVAYTPKKFMVTIVGRRLCKQKSVVMGVMIGCVMCVGGFQHT